MSEKIQYLKNESEGLHVKMFFVIIGLSDEVSLKQTAHHILMQNIFLLYIWTFDQSSPKRELMIEFYYWDLIFKSFLIPIRSPAYMPSKATFHKIVIHFHIRHIEFSLSKVPWVVLQQNSFSNMP